MITKKKSRWLAPAVVLILFFLNSGAAGSELCPFSDDSAGYVSPFDDQGVTPNPSPFPADDPASQSPPCPFPTDDSTSTNPSPFPADDPASQSPPCPFPTDDSTSTNPSPFPADDPASQSPPCPFPIDEPGSAAQICPFPVEFTSSSTGDAGLLTSSPVLPSDPDGNGLYEDLNGNGRTDFNDVVIFFNAMEWISLNQPVVAFDYNGNGRIDFNDLIFLTGTL